MYFLTKEDQIKAIQSRIEALRTAAGYYPIITKVFQDFDGKVYNCRLEKALKAATDNKVYCRVYAKWIEIYYYDHGEQFTLANVQKDGLKDGKRIDAEHFTEAARKCRTDHLKEAADLETALCNLDVYMDQLKQVKHAYLGIVGKMPYYVRDVCNIKPYI